MEFFKNSDWHLTDCFPLKGKELQNYLTISFWSGFKWVKRLSIYMAALKSLLFQGYFFNKKKQFVAEFLKNSDWLSSRLFLWKKNVFGISVSKAAQKYKAFRLLRVCQQPKSRKKNNDLWIWRNRTLFWEGPIWCFRSLKIYSHLTKYFLNFCPNYKG